MLFLAKEIEKRLPDLCRGHPSNHQSARINTNFRKPETATHETGRCRKLQANLNWHEMPARLSNKGTVPTRLVFFFVEPGFDRRLNFFIELLVVLQNFLRGV